MRRQLLLPDQIFHRGFSATVATNNPSASTGMAAAGSRQNAPQLETLVVHLHRPLCGDAAAAVGASEWAIPLGLGQSARKC